VILSVENNIKETLKEYIRSILYSEQKDYQLPLDLDSSNHPKITLPSEDVFFSWIFPYTFVDGFYTDIQELNFNNYILNAFCKKFFGKDSILDLSDPLQEMVIKYFDKNALSPNCKLQRLTTNEFLPLLKRDHYRCVYSVKLDGDRNNPKRSKSLLYIQKMISEGLGMENIGKKRHQMSNAHFLVDVGDKPLSTFYPWVILDIPFKYSGMYSGNESITLRTIRPEYVVAINGMPKTEFILAMR
jgi:hypothetical protein